MLTQTVASPDGASRASVEAASTSDETPLSGADPTADDPVVNPPHAVTTHPMTALAQPHRVPRLVMAGAEATSVLEVYPSILVRGA
jgi:hypothetical protein